VIDPEAFSGLAAFREQMDWISDACVTNPPAKGIDRVRLPGQRGLELMKRQLREGVRLKLSLIESLTRLGTQYGVPLPTAR